MVTWSTVAALTPFLFSGLSLTSCWAQDRPGTRGFARSIVEMLHVCDVWLLSGAEGAVRPVPGRADQTDHHHLHGAGAPAAQASDWGLLSVMICLNTRLRDESRMTLHAYMVRVVNILQLYVLQIFVF